MSIKTAIIKTNNVLCYIVIALVGLVAFSIFMSGNVGIAIATGLGGWVICCIVYGFWFVLVSISENTTKQNMLLEQQLTLMSSIYKKIPEDKTWDFDK